MTGIDLRRRRAGILLHPTCLPGRFGIGDLGPEALRFLDWAAEAGQSLWQILPLHPPVFGGSPYAALSAFAGNPLLISPEGLHADGLLSDQELQAAEMPQLATGIDFGAVERRKLAMLRSAWHHFRQHHFRQHHIRRSSKTSPTGDWARFRAWNSHPSRRLWLDEWALFMALKRRRQGRPWFTWARSVAKRQPAALDAQRTRLGEAMDFERFVQFVFDRQWRTLHQAARDRGIDIVGDLPIYVAHDSADVWTHRHLFDLDTSSQPREVAGVPPDAFTDSGQLWGNPLYRWQRCADEDFAWWIERLRAAFDRLDILRIDHFRGLVDYWAVPAGDATAEHGRWRPGPGRALFDAARNALGELPLMAEDLGVITEQVTELRDALELPGMRVLHFGFESEPNAHTPHRLDRRAAVYTGTHDNDTTVGWYRGLDGDTRRRFHHYLGGRPRKPHEALMRLAYQSPSTIAMVPIQDVLGLGSEARLNTPGTDTADRMNGGVGNWSWRLSPGALNTRRARRLRQLTATYERLASDDAASCEAASHEALAKSGQL